MDTCGEVTRAVVAGASAVGAESGEEMKLEGEKKRVDGNAEE